MLLRSFLPLFLAVHAAAQGTELKSSLQGEYTLLGSFCFEGGVAASIDFVIENKATYEQHLVFYDDEPGSFPSVSQETASGASMTCEEKVNMGRSTSTGDGSEKKYRVIAPGNTLQFTDHISEAFGREWFFVLASCGKGPTNADYTITTSDSIDCDKIYAAPSRAGYEVAIVFLTLISASLLGASVMFYRRSQAVAFAGLQMGFEKDNLDEL